MMQNSLLTKIKAFLLVLGSNPIVAWVVRQATTSGSAYIVSNPFTPEAWQKWAVNGAVFVVGGVVHAFDIWLQQQVANNNGPRNQQLNPGQAPQSHMEMLKARLKMVVLLLAASALFAPGAFAWDIQSKALVQNKDANRVGMSYFMTAPSSPEVDGILMPTASIAMNPFADLGAPSYGYTVDEALLIARVSDAGGGHVNVSNIIGATAGFYSDLYPLIKGSGPWIVKGELGVIGPDIGTGVVPGVQAVYDFAGGEKQVLVNLNIPIGVFEEDTVVKLFGL
jgi:hypothetical protein